MITQEGKETQTNKQKPPSTTTELTCSYMRNWKSKFSEKSILELRSEKSERFIMKQGWAISYNWKIVIEHLAFQEKEETRNGKKTAWGELRDTMSTPSLW